MKSSEIWNVDASQQKKCYKKTFFGFWPFLADFNQKTAKIDQKWRKLAKSKPFDEIFWNLVCRCFPTKKMLQFFFVDFAFFGRFLPKKQPKLKKIEENWQNPNRLMNFSEIWFVDASQQNKMLQKNFFWISAFFGRFSTKKQPKLTKN